MAIDSPKNDFVEKHRWLTYANDPDTVYDGSKIIDGSVTTDKLADYAVTTDKIDDESITLSKMNTDVLNLLEGNVKGFDTVADMQAAILEAGEICHTNGFHTSGDGGAAFYKISATGTANGMDVLTCGDVFANLIITESYVTPEMFGAWGDGVHDDTTVIAKCFTNRVVEFGSGKTYLINQAIAASGNKCVYGNNSTILLATLESDLNDYAIGYADVNGITIDGVSIVAQSHELTDFAVPSGHTKVTGETSSGWHGIRFRHCSNVTIRNCYFEGVTFGIAVLPGSASAQGINASTNINIVGNYFKNVKNCYIFQYCNYANFSGNKHTLDIPTNDGYHTYYLEAYIGHVTISDEITICDPSDQNWAAYDFASYAGTAENAGRVITLDNVQAIAPRFFATYGNYDIEASNCIFNSNCVSSTTISFMFLAYADNASIRFNNCRFDYGSSAPNMILLGYSNLISKSEAIFNNCYIKVGRLIVYSPTATDKTIYATFNNCKMIASSNGLTPVPASGALMLNRCDVEGDVAWTPSFITGQDIASDSVVTISRCTFTTLVDSSPASILGVIGNMPTINVFGCQLLVPNTAAGGGLFRTEPTNKAANYSRYTAV